MSTALVVSPSPELLPTPLFAPTPTAAKRFIEFLTAQINNHHTRKSYLNATRRFAEWCDTHGLRDLVDVEPFHIAAFFKDLQGKFSPPTVKQHLAALRMLFDWLVTGQVIATNPAHAVRGPKYVVKRGKTPVLASDEARTLLDSLDINTLKGLRDRALIGVMVYIFARISAVHPGPPRLGTAARERRQGTRGAPAPYAGTISRRVHAAAGIAGDPDGFLFRTTGRKTGLAGRMYQQDAYRMIQRQVLKAGLGTRAGNHIFPRDRHHRLPEKQWPAGTRPDDRQPFVTAYDEAL
jgi:hypothetical protein